MNGWQQIAEFLGQPLSLAERWAKAGMPVTHEGRRVRTSSDELNRWLGRESAGEPVQIATETADLTSELKRGLSFVREALARPKEEESGVMVQPWHLRGVDVFTVRDGKVSRQARL